ncbi:MAG: phosphatidylglycerol lysyltransferase domain-containing protein [Thermoanaerobaculia bacterium]
MSQEDAQRLRLLGLLRRHGWNATSFQAIEPEFRYWFDSGGDAAIAYLDTGRAWVVAGAPIASLDRCAVVAERFTEEARRWGRRVAFFATEPRFLREAPMRSLVIGAQPSWDPRSWTERHRGHRGLKEQLRRARAKGVSVERVASGEAAGGMRPELERLIARWLAARPMPPMSFLVALEPFVFPEERRYYVARAGGAVAGLLVAVPVYERGGWFFEDILRDPASPKGTTELMIDAAMRDVAGEGCTFVTLGLAPLAGTEEWHRLTRRLMRGFYNFEGVRTFKAKLRPDEWMPIFLAWPGDRTAASALYDVLDAFAGGRPVRFAIRAVGRAPSPVIFALGALLVPWSAALALADSERWFRSRREQFGWVAFDVVMAGALLSLSRKWRRPLAGVLCAAALTDGMLTTVSVARGPAPRVRRWSDALVVAAAVAAPFAAAAILFGGLRARRG